MKRYWGLLIDLHFSINARKDIIKKQVIMLSTLVKMANKKKKNISPGLRFSNIK